MYIYIDMCVCGLSLAASNSRQNFVCPLHDWQLMQSLVAVVDEELLQGVELESLHHHHDRAGVRRMHSVG